MLRHARPRPSPALVVSVVALFVALGGSAYALTITGSQVKDGSLTGADIKNKSLNAARELKINSIGGRTVKESRLGPVPRATRADFAGAASIANRLSPTKLTVRTASAVVPASSPAGDGKYATRPAQQVCGAGETAIAIGTRWSSDIDDDELVTVYSRFVLDGAGKPTGVRARGGNDTATARTFTAEVVCAAG